MIDAIGTVEYTEECKGKIEAARSAYDVLSEKQKAYVSNYSILINAEARYIQLEKIATGIVDVKDNNGRKNGKYLMNGKVVIVKNGKVFNINGLTE